MSHYKFSKKDLEQIQTAGQTVEKVHSQLLLFHQGTPFVKLDRPCTTGDGITKLSDDIIEQCIQIYESQGIKKNLIKFVPASGAATRMFKKLIHAYQAQQAGATASESMSEPVRNELAAFMENCHRFAFCKDLNASLSAEGLNLDICLARQDYESVLRHLLTRAYLDYAMLPKGLIKFHSYGNNSRTAFEEHLVEAGGYARTENNVCAIHFTVPPQYQKKFTSFFQEIRRGFEKACQTRFEVAFSTQDPATNTIAVDMENQPFRLPDGRLLFRPGGHGALVNNLNRLDGDIVFIKNIDNVTHERFIGEMIEWKKILCGYLLILQQQIFHFLTQLHQQPISQSLTQSIRDFLKTQLFVELPKHFSSESDDKKQQTLIRLLDRPIRVCGMVPNTGDPGGGPFWIKNHENSLSKQIVESSQINTADKEQHAILKHLNHFNPVDLVCGIRNWRGDLFDLSAYVDHQAVFITNKSENGRELKALELPGLWNGGMAFWTTAFVEVPKNTFNPVKEVSNLLEAPHQPGS